MTILHFISINTGCKKGNRSEKSSSSGSTLSTAAIQEYVDRMKCDGIRSSTKRNYYTFWRIFNEFFIQLDCKPNSWEDRLILFVGYLIKNNKKLSTIKSYISGIKAILREVDVYINEDRFLLCSLTSAGKLVNDKVRTRLPIQKGLLLLILFHKQPYLDIMYCALFSTTYFGLFRVSEVTSGSHPIKACDVHVGKNKNKMMFVLRTSKTHWMNVKPPIVKITGKDFDHKKNSKTKRNTLSPFERLQLFVTARPTYLNRDEPFFVFSDRSAVLPKQMRVILRKALKYLGLDQSLYDVHSLRIGRRVHLNSMKISVESIKKLGRWTSDAVFEYLKINIFFT